MEGDINDQMFEKLKSLIYSEKTGITYIYSQIYLRLKKETRIHY